MLHDAIVFYTSTIVHLTNFSQKNCILPKLLCSTEIASTRGLTFSISGNWIDGSNHNMIQNSLCTAYH